MVVNYLIVIVAFLLLAPDIAAWITAEHALWVFRGFGALIAVFLLLRFTPLLPWLSRRNDAAFFAVLWGVEFVIACAMIGTGFVAFHLFSFQDAAQAIAAALLPSSGIAGTP